MALASRQTSQPLQSNSSEQSSGASALVVLIICCMLSVVSMTVWVREGDSGALHRLRDGFSMLTAPMQSLGYSLTTPLRSLGQMLDNNNMTSSEIEAIRAENAFLRSEVIRLEEYEQEARRLSELMDIVNIYELEAVGARVINRSVDPWDRTITINRGTRAGVRVGMPVMSANGIIGRVEAAGPDSAVVRLMTDQDSAMAVFLQGYRTEGVMEGSADGTLYMRYVGLDVNIEPGMTVVTSGLDGVYPKGIPVGTVQSVSFSPNDIYQTIVIAPLDRVGSFEEVMVIIGSDSDGRSVNPPGDSGEGSE